MGTREKAREVPFQEESPMKPLGGPVGEAGSSEEEAMPSAKKLMTVDRMKSYV